MSLMCKFGVVQFVRSKTWILLSWHFSDRLTWKCHTFAHHTPGRLAPSSLATPEPNNPHRRCLGGHQRCPPYGPSSPGKTVEAVEANQYLSFGTVGNLTKLNQLNNPFFQLNQLKNFSNLWVLQICGNGPVFVGQAWTLLTVPTTAETRLPGQWLHICTRPKPGKRTREGANMSQLPSFSYMIGINRLGWTRHMSWLPLSAAPSTV